ncbi:uncharacterized protein K02A2.6-like, partial [Scyliorhinus canicula]|uniref:uncharacterized protein K02A2.6-like n=1 Tax=Scyliorhinus canicula TaxID=7830 RepID=UPI0018F35CCC
RPVPYALLEKVEGELTRLETLGIIRPVRFADWAAPIVPVIKPDATVRLCGDYKLTVNTAFRLDRYPMPRIEDLYAKLAGGLSFTKLDMSHAYLQLELDPASRPYVTINTHRGLYEYTRLPFGVSSACDIFQRIMEGILRGLPRVAVYSDDVLITETSEQEHLEAVLRRFSEAGVR